MKSVELTIKYCMELIIEIESKFTIQICNQIYKNNSEHIWYIWNNYCKRNISLFLKCINDELRNIFYNWIENDIYDGLNNQMQSMKI